MDCWRGRDDLELRDAPQSAGHYDPAHNAIVISRVFDHPRVPEFVIEYIVYQKCCT